MLVAVHLAFNLLPAQRMGMVLILAKMEMVKRKKTVQEMMAVEAEAVKGNRFFKETGRDIIPYLIEKQGCFTATL